MDRVKQQLQRIAEQMGALTASQRMLAAALVAIMVMTLLWWGRYAATPEMVPVLDRSITGDDLVRMRSALAGAGIGVRVVNDRIMVPAERQMEALGVLGYDKLLPTDSADAWDEIVNKQSSPWETAEKTKARFNRGKELMLSQLIKQYFPNVVSASVVIEPEMKRSLSGGGDIKPSASIFISADNDADMKRLANGAASMVASAQAGLSVGQVSVSINGRAYRPTDPDGGDSFGDGELQETLQLQERYYAGKIRDEVLPHVPGALVTVSVDMEINSSEETKRTYDPAKTFGKESYLESDTSESTNTMPAAPAEPGATANTGLAIEQAQTASGAGGGGNTTTTEKNRTQIEIFPSESVEKIKKPPGKHTVQRAAVRVPQSYFVAQYKARNPSATTEPDDAALQPLITAELDSIRAQVMACCGMNDAELVSVSPYFDIVPPMAVASEERSTRPSGGSSSSLIAMVSSHVKEISIGLLAVVSLFIVSSMVRKTSPVTTMTTPIELREVASLAPDEDIAGEAREGSAMLDGMELDEDTIKAQQMVEQVSTMVEENPDGAASLVKRWLNRS